jgi:hypothetical protein
VSDTVIKAEAGPRPFAMADAERELRAAIDAASTVES